MFLIWIQWPLSLYLTANQLWVFFVGPGPVRLAALLLWRRNASLAGGFAGRLGSFCFWFVWWFAIFSSTGQLCFVLPFSPLMSLSGPCHRALTAKLEEKRTRMSCLLQEFTVNATRSSWRWSVAVVMTKRPSANSMLSAKSGWFPLLLLRGPQPPGLWFWSLYPIVPFGNLGVSWGCRPMQSCLVPTYRWLCGKGSDIELLRRHGT